eukprot:TRINITY_DN5196_c0_g1_i1.p1 TRINITY_DN5196_c0_g1~~TRINITY_DN5196_c0_g1_i1.p1  ORF type:complete len:565 (+),score=153.84 TRINITY_DN5196_c0_g1_i1:43-1737(+)
MMRVAFGVLAVVLAVRAEDECTSTATTCKNIRYTTKGCQCACPWTMTQSGNGPKPSGPGFDSPCVEGCCNPDNEAAGDWCFLAATQFNVDNGCIPSLTGPMPHGTCTAKGSPAPSPAAPAPATLPNICEINKQDCVDPDPNTPNDWTCVCRSPLSGTGQQQPATCIKGATSSPATGAPSTSAPSTPTTSSPTTSAPATSAPGTPTTSAPATSAPATRQCGIGGSQQGDCCVCKLGWAKDVDGACTKCTKGFYGSKFGYCTNTRPGSQCIPGKAAPLGCGRGSCTRQGESYVFPCNCGSTGLDESTFCENKKTCLPNGPSVYTPFPNRPVANEPFNVLVVGCELSKDDEYMLIPTWKNQADGVKNTCGDMQSSEFETSGCSFVSGDVAPPTNCSKGVHVKGPHGVFYDDVKRSNARASITGVTLSKAYLNGNDKLEFTVCSKGMRMAPSGEMEEVWRTIDGHNEDVSMRDESFMVDLVRNVRSAPGGGDGECCEGLKIGSLCLPLWVFLLLWLLMACCVGVLGYALHKNKNDIEGIKNNQKYENFGQDAEMLDLAAANASDDDDL